MIFNVKSLKVKVHTNDFLIRTIFHIRTNELRPVKHWRLGTRARTMLHNAALVCSPHSSHINNSPCWKRVNCCSLFSTPRARPEQNGTTSSNVHHCQSRWTVPCVSRAAPSMAPRIHGCVPGSRLTNLLQAQSNRAHIRRELHQAAQSWSDNQEMEGDEQQIMFPFLTTCSSALPQSNI